MHKITSLYQLCYPWQVGMAGALLLGEEAVGESKFWECIIFDEGFEQFPVLQGKVGEGWALCAPGVACGGDLGAGCAFPQSCEAACASGPALLSFGHCSLCAHQLRCSPRLCPHAVALCGSHHGFAVAVVGALPLAAGCLRLHGRHLPQMPARLLVLKLEWQVVGPQAPMVLLPRRQPAC